MFAVKTDSEAGSQLPLMAEMAKSSGQRGHHIASAVARIADMLAAKISGQKSCIMICCRQTEISAINFILLSCERS